jgi:pimeloyl-ACP methyl ester carboxylesterase
VKNLLASMTAYSGVGYVATAYTISRWLTRATPSRPTKPDLPAPLDCQERECQTADGLRLSGWVVSPPNPIGNVALFHGLRGDREQTLSRLAMLAAAGYRCVTFDHRGHGASDGRLTSFGYYESRDVIAVRSFMESSWPGEPAAALGISMGAAAVCFAAAQGARFDALILESLYPRLANAFQNRVGCGYPAWFGQFRAGVIWITELRLGVKLEQVAPVDIMPQLAPAPVLLLTGGDDPHAPPDEVAQLHHTYPSTSAFHVIPGGDHSNVCEAGGDLYQDLVLDFLRHRLPAAPACVAA